MKKPLKIVLALLLLAALGAGAFFALRETPEQKAARYLRQGDALYEQQHYGKARLNYKNAARLRPTDVELEYRLGLVDEAEGNIRNAFAYYIRAEQQQARFRPALIKIAQYFLAAEQYAETEKRLAIVLEDAPEDPDAHAIQGALHLRRGDHENARKEALYALERDGDNITAYAVLVGLYSAKGDLEQADKTVEEAIAKNPKELSLLFLKAKLYENPLNVEKVAEAYRAIFALKPRHEPYRIALADILQSAGREDDAEAVLRQAIADLPESWTLKHRLIVFVNKRHGMEAAEKEIRAALDAHPDREELYFWLTDLYLSHQAVDKAVALLESLIAKSEESELGLNARTALARIQFVRGNRRLAEKMTDAVLEKAPGNRPARLIRANLAADQGRYADAVSDLRAVLHGDKRSKEALKLLAEVLLLQGRTDLAIDTLSQLLDIDPLNSAARVRLAQMYHANGDSRHALQLLSVVTRNDPSYAIGWESTARIALEAKDTETANRAIATLSGIEGQQLTSAFLQGGILAGEGRIEEAVASYRKIIDTDPGSPLAEHALTALLNIYRSAGQLEKGAEYIVSLDTGNPYFNTMLGKAYLQLGRKDDAAQAFEKAIANGAPDQEAYLERARLHLEAQQPQQALELLKTAAGLTPSDLRAPVMAASALAAAGKPREAIALYEDVLLRNPTHDIAANNMAALIADHAYTDAALLEKARMAAERFAGARAASLLDTLAWVYYRQGNLTQAEAVMKRAMADEKGLTPEMHYHYGAILARLNKTGEARRELEKALVPGASRLASEEARKILSTL